MIEAAAAAAFVAVLCRWALVAWRQHRTPLFRGEARDEVFRRWGKRCAYRFPVVWHRCSPGLDVDHQVPKSKGVRGRTRVRNGQPLCAAINRRRKLTARNSVFVLRHAVPVVGHGWYLARWTRAEIVMPVVLVLRRGVR